jgi:predicted Zn-dependent peptidase
MLISVAGRFDQKELKKLLNNRLPEFRDAESPNKRTVPAEHRKWDYQSGHFSQINVLTGFTFPLPSDIEELYGFLIFSTLFGESMSSRLFQNIRENEGLCYSIYSIRSFFDSLAMWTIYAGTTVELLDHLIESLDRELNSALHGDISDTEISNAITHLVGGVILSKEDMEVRMKQLVRHFILGGELCDIPTTISKLESMTKKHVIDLINNYLYPKPFNFLAYGTRKLHRKKKKYFTIGEQG